MRQRQRVCKRGHDLEQTRRLRSDGWSAGCQRCSRDRLNARRRENRKLRMEGGTRPYGVQLTLPFEPLDRVLKVMEVDLGQFNRRSLTRWRSEGVSVYTADRIACSLGIHPVQVYGMDFYEGVA